MRDREAGWRSLRGWQVILDITLKIAGIIAIFVTLQVFSLRVDLLTITSCEAFVDPEALRRTYEDLQRPMPSEVSQALLEAPVPPLTSSRSPGPGQCDPLPPGPVPAIVSRLHQTLDEGEAAVAEASLDGARYWLAWVDAYNNGSAAALGFHFATPSGWTQTRGPTGPIDLAPDDRFRYQFRSTPGAYTPGALVDFVPKYSTDDRVNLPLYLGVFFTAWLVIVGPGLLAALFGRRAEQGEDGGSSAAGSAQGPNDTDERPRPEKVTPHGPEN